MSSNMMKAIFLVYLFGSVVSTELLISNICESINNQICSISNIHTDSTLSLRFDENMTFNPENIIFNDCGLPTIPPIFSVFTKIKVFIMKNCGLQIVQQKDFEYARSVQLLALKNNSIEDLPDKVFFSLIKLEDIRLSHNYLFHLHSNAFFGLEKLKYLDLGYNKIREIHADLFCNLISLENIDLQYNKIEKIDSSIFEHNSKLQTILLNNNRIIVFEGNSIKHVPQLHLLDVSFNVIDGLYIQSVNSLKANNAGLKELHINGSVTNLSVNNNNLKRLIVSNRNLITRLELHNNFISSISDLDGMRNLEELDLSHNPVECLDVTALSHLPNLVKLNLSATYIQNLTADSLLLQENLAEIDLTFNRMLTLNVEVFEKLKSLQKLYISGETFMNLNYEDLKERLHHLDVTLETSDWNCTQLSSILHHLKNLHINVNLIPIHHSDCKHKIAENYCKFKSVTPSKVHHNFQPCNVSAQPSGKQHSNGHKPHDNLMLVLVIFTFLIVVALFAIQIVKYFDILKNSWLCSRRRGKPISSRLQEETDCL